MSDAEESRRVVHATRSILDGTDIRVLVCPWRTVSATTWPMHVHDEHELMIVGSGFLSLEIDGALWTVPPTLGVWIPAGTAHRADADAGTTFQCTYVSAVGSPIDWERTTVVTVNGMLTAMLSHLTREDLGMPARQRAESVFFDLITPAAETGIELPMPQDDRARRIAEALLSNPADDRRLEDWGWEVGASARTLQRLFATQTGLGFDQWRVQARVRVALVRLAQGAPVAEVSRSLGYRSVSAFVLRFSRVTGLTPREFAKRSTGAFSTSPVG